MVSDDEIQKSLFMAGFPKNEIDDLTEVFKDYLRRGMSFNQALDGVIKLYIGPIGLKNFDETSLKFRGVNDG